MVTLIGLPVTPAAAVPSSVTTPLPAARAQTAGAQTAATAAGPTEITASRTENTRTFANPDGSLTEEQYLAPQRVRRADGSWAPVNTRLTAAGDGTVAPYATPARLAFSAGGTAPLARLGFGEFELALHWPIGTLPPPTIVDSTATYAEVLPGVDLTVTASETGFSHTLVVKTRTASTHPALARIRYGLSTTVGTTLSVAPGGGLVATMNRTGRTVFEAPRPLMWDSSGSIGNPATTGGSGATGTTGDMLAELSGGDLLLTPDRSLLDDPATVYPVYLDPSWAVSGAFNNEWTTVWEKRPTTSFWRNTTALDNVKYKGALGAGLTRDDNCSGCAPYHIYSYFRMSLQGVQNKQINKATLRMRQTWSWVCNSTVSKAQVWQAGSHPTPQTTWNNRPAFGAASAVVTANRRYGATSGCLGPGTVEFNVTAMVRSAAASWQTISFAMRGVNDGDPNYWKRYDHTSLQLIVEYNTRPNVPTAAQLKIRPDATAPDQPCASGATARPALRMATPQLRATVTDPDGNASGQLRATFAWQRWTGSAWAALGSRSSPAVPHGAVATTTIDSGLVDNGVYRWQVTTTDGTGLAATGASVWCEFEVHVTGPQAAPLVSSADGLYTAGDTPRGSKGRSGRFTVTANNVPEVAGYEYWLYDSGTRYTVTPAALGGPVTVWATPTQRGPADLNVRSYDRAGNYSNTTTYVFTVADPSGPAATWRLDENTGTTLAATGPAAVPATLTATGASWSGSRLRAPGPGATGAVDKGVAVQLSGGYAQTAGPVVNITQAFSVSAWVRLDTATGNPTVISQDGTSRSGFHLGYRLDVGGKWCFTMFNGDSAAAGAPAACSTPAGRLGVWTHLTGVYDPGASRQLAVYVNGALAATTPFVSTWNATGPLAIGRAWYRSAVFDRWTGALDDVRVYDRVVYPDDILPLVRPALVARYHFEDGDGTSAADASGYLNTATLSAAPTATWADGFGSGGGVRLAGGTSCVTSARPALRTDQSFSVGGWVRLDAVPTNTRMLLSQDGTAVSGFYLGIRIVDGAARWTFNVHPSDSTAVTSSRVVGPVITDGDVGVWRHLAGVFDAEAQKIRFYVDGVFAGEADKTARWSADGPLVIGRSMWTPTGGTATHADHLAGSVDGVLVYAGAMTHDEVTADLLYGPTGA